MKKLTQNLAGLLAAATALPGLLMLVAWQFGMWRVTTFGPGYIPMAPVTAVLFVLLGLALGGQLFRPARRSVRWGLRSAGGLVLLVAGLTLLQERLGLTLPWDRWFSSHAEPVGLIPVGRMAPLTAGVFLLSGLALLIRPVLRTWLRWTGTLVALGSFLTVTLVVAGYAAGTPISYTGDTVPMALLTALTFMAFNLSLLLSGPAMATVHRWFDFDATPHPARERHFTRLIAGIASALAALIGVAGFLYVRSEQTMARETVRRELQSVANLKATQLSQWREERLGEGRFLQRTPAIAEDIGAYLARPDDRAARERVRGWLEPIKGGDRYESISLYDAQYGLRLAVPASGRESPGHPQTFLAVAGAQGGALLTDLHRDPTDGRVHLSLVVPVYPGGRVPAETGAGPAPLAFILLRLDPAHTLFPLLLNWPVPTATAETLLVRREGDEVAYLSELRHRPGSALLLRRSVHEPMLPAARAARNEEAVREGRDYRGVPVLTSVRAIPDSPWILIAKIDQAEVYAPIRREAWRSGLMVMLLLIAIVLAAAFLWRQRHAATLQRMLAAEQARKALDERLALVMRHAGDIILLMDDTGRILEANERALSTYGCTLEELRALPPGGLRPPGPTTETAAQLGTLLTPEGGRFETVHRRKDGSEFPVEVSGRLVTIEGRRLALGIYRDITQRRVHEAEIERLNRLYAVLSQVNQAIVRATCRENLFPEICRVLIEFGRFPLAWIGWADPAAGVITPVAAGGDRTGYLRDIRVRTDDSPEGQGAAGRAFREDRIQVCNDLACDPQARPWREAAARAGLQASIALPVRLAGKPVGVLSVYAGEPGFFGPREIALLEEAAMDVAFALDNLQRDVERAQAERALRTNEVRFRTIFDHAPVGISFTEVDGGILVNAEHARITGVPVAQSNVPGVFARASHPEDYAKQMVAALRFHRGEVGHYTIEKRYLHPDGRVQWAELTSRLYIDPATNRRVIVTIITDIAARKESEIRLNQQLEELQRWQEVTLGREGRILELKREVNELSHRAGLAPRYPSAAAGAVPSDHE